MELSSLNKSSLLWWLLLLSSSVHSIYPYTFAINEQDVAKHLVISFHSMESIAMLHSTRHTFDNYQICIALHGLKKVMISWRKETAALLDVSTVFHHWKVICFLVLLQVNRLDGASYIFGAQPSYLPNLVLFIWSFQNARESCCLHAVNSENNHNLSEPSV